MRKLLQAVLPLAASGASLVLAPAAPAQGADQTCVLALTRFDAATVNVAYPDDSAQYWSGAYAAVPGMRIRITGRFPHARYMSFHVYDPAARPLDGLTDVRIEPDPGSVNPFVAGADRTGAQRSYTALIEFGPRPEQPEPNTLYTGTGQNGAPNVAGTFMYRIYIPDAGRDETGDVGLPTATLEPADAPGATAASPCTGVTKPSVGGVNELVAQQATPVDAPVTSGTNPPTWRKFVNFLSAASVTLAGTPSPGGADLDTIGGNGGFVSNLDNAYVSTTISRAHGRILVTRQRAPSYPDTRPGAVTMPGGQLRYWSMCENDPPSQRYIACVNDDRAVVGPDGFATFVVSTPADRPASATAQCGVNWLPWGPNQRGILIYRHMLPAPDFGQSIQDATADREGETMGEHLPVSRYYASAGAYQADVGCGA